MHYSLTVALPGCISAKGLRAALHATMDRFDENRSVPLHRDISIDAEPLDRQVARARQSAQSDTEDWTVGLSDLEIARTWSGANAFDDADGWPLTTANPDGHWDYWGMGGSSWDAWHLRTHGQSGPLSTCEPPETDNARWRDLVVESVRPTYAWIDLAGDWYTRWIGPTRAEALGDEPHNYEAWVRPAREHEQCFMRFLSELPLDTWLCLIDYHS